jgi:capsular polysaccharide biosynthesis protein
MNISGSNIVVYKDNKVEKCSIKPYKITGDKIVEMFENHNNTFHMLFGENESYTYYDVMTLFKKNNVHIWNGTIINFTFLDKIIFSQMGVIKEAAFLQSPWGCNFFHFITEELPNFLKVIQHYPNIPVIFSINNTFVGDILNLLNIKNDIFQTPPLNVVLKIENCILPNPSIPGKPSKSELLLVRNYFIEKKLLDFQMLDLGVIIKRTDGERQISNIDEIYEHVKSEYKNINWFIFENPPFQTALNLFSKAKIVIGAHGAGLTNMLFTPDTCNIIEVMPYSDPNECYFHMASVLDLNYNCIVVEDSGKENGKKMNLKIEHLDKILKTII